MKAWVPVMLAVISMLILAPSIAHAHFNPPLITPDHTSLAVEGKASALAPSSDGSLLAVGTDAGLLYLVNTSSGELLWATALQGGVTGISVDSSMSRIIVASNANELAIFNRNGSLETMWERCTRYGVSSLSVTSEGYILVTDNGGWLYAYSPSHVEGRGEAYPANYTYASPSGDLRVNVSSVVDSSLILTSSGSGDEVAVLVEATVFDNTTGNATTATVPGVMIYSVGDRSIGFKHLYLLDGLRMAPYMIRYFTVGTQKAVLVAAGNSIYIYGLSSQGQGPTRLEYSWTYPFGGKISVVRIKPGGDRIIVYAADGNVYCFDKAYALRYTYRWSIALGAGGDALAVSSDFRTMAAGSSEGWVYVFDVDLGTRLWRAWFAETPVTAIALSSNSYLAAAGYSGQVHMLLNADHHRNLLEVSVYDYAAAQPLSGTNVTLSMGSTTIHGETPATFLLPSGNYSLHLDNLYVGVYDTSIGLSSDTILVVPADKLSQPIYKLIIKTSDNETSSPVEGVKIEAYNILTNKTYEASTNAYGEATLSLPRGPYIVNATHPLYYPVTMNIGWLTSDETISLRLTPRRAEITISVESPVLGPIENAVISLYGPEPAKLVTGRNGVASAKLRLGTYTVRVEAPHHEAYTATVSLYSDVSLRVVMTPLNYTLRIKALDAEYMTPIQLYHVIIVGSLNTHIDTYMSPGNDSVVLPYGNYTVRVEARGFYPETYSVYLDRDTGIELDLQPIRVVLELRVSSSSIMGPLQGANVTLTGPENITSYTDTQGYTKIYARIGVYRITVKAPHHVPYTSIIPLIADTYLSIQLKPQNYTLTLIVRDAETGRQLGSVPIIIQGPSTRPIVKITGVITPSNDSVSLPYGTYSIVVSPRYYHAYHATIAMASNTSLEIYVAPIRLNIAVYVVSETTGPISNARVMLIGPEQLQNNTGVNGLAFFKPRMGNYTIRVDAAFHYTYTGQVFIGESKTIRIVLKPIKYTLRIIARDSETLEALPLVTATLQGPSGISRLNITPGTLLTLPYGNYKITLDAPGYREASISLEPLYYSQTITVDMTPIKKPVTIMVLDPLHGPISRANISITGVETLSLTTDRFGRASASLRLGNYTILVSAPHHENYTTHISVKEAVNLKVMLQPLNYTLSIRALDARTGKIIGNWTASITGAGVKLNLTMSPGNDSVVLPYGNYTVRVYSTHYVYGRRDVSLNTNKVLIVTLHPLEYSVVVRVQAKPIGPLKNAAIQAYWSGRLVATAKTDKLGVAVLKLPYGNYTLIVGKEFFKPYKAAVTVSKPLQVNVSLEPVTFTVTVRVLDSETGKPIPRGVFELYSPTYNATFKGNITNGAGSTVVMPAPYILLVKAADHVTYKAQINVTGSKTITVKLKPIYYAVMIRVVDDRGKPIKHAWIEVKAAKPISGYTDSTGTFVTNLKKGGYPILVKAPGYHSKQDSILVAGPVSKTVKLFPTPVTMLHRYIALIVALVIAPAVLLGGALWYRRRRERLLEEEMESLEEI